MATIELYFDFLSPYAYLAWKRIHALAERCEAQVEPRPILFAAVLNHHGQKGPAEIPAKRRYVFKDTLRRARLAGVPFSAPPTHPFNPLLALRSVLAAPIEARAALVDALFDATWGDAPEKGLEHAEVVRAAAERARLDGGALLARAGSDEIKAALRAETERAIARGVFGVPTMRVEGELFWGYDSLDLVELHLRGEDPITPALVAAIPDPQASAARIKT